MRTTLLVFALLLLCVPLFAHAAPRQQDLSSCQASRDGGRLLWQHDLYTVPPDIPPIMLAAINGETSKVLDALAALQPKNAKRWRQVAFYTAVWAGQSTTVEALLDSGADLNASALIPPLKAEFYKQTMGQFAQNWHLDSKTVQKLKAKRILSSNSNHAETGGLYLMPTIVCDDLATANVLLRHHANPMPHLSPNRGDPFVLAVALSEADITQAFLDHGANPCIEDRRLADIAKKRHHTPLPTLASMGAKQGLPPALVQRLTCHAPGSSG